MIADVQAAAAEAWFAHYAVGLYVLDRELWIVSADLATQLMGGVPAERALRRRLTDVYSFSSPSFSASGQIEEMLRDVLDSGVPAPERDVVRLRLRDVPGRACWARVSAFRLEDQHGGVLGGGGGAGGCRRTRNKARPPPPRQRAVGAGGADT